ncbi:MAG: transcriptional regulator GcvA [Aestuariivita sp.]|nr:transcriptional regulator GcvA [Aestuariivita sp.]MCY4345778.1 transcriptional regulator GcvA [Aestuariivita sp.]
MVHRLPPLTALRAFDAAARHMSFSNAANELNVTTSALSFQIKTLEEHLGQPLFHRHNRAVSLTEAGRILAPGLKDAFATMLTSWRAACRVQSNSTLSVTAGPSFTAKWLAPRIYQFAQTHSEIDLRFYATLRVIDLRRDDIDVAIRYGHGDDEDCFSKVLATEWVTPVTTPEVAERFPTPESLQQAPLIFDQSLDILDPPCDWPAWFRAVGMDFQPEHGPRFSQADHAVDAALAGVGITLGRRALVVKDISEGRLVAPYGVALTPRAHLRFVCLEGAQDRPQVKAFLTWMLQEIDKLTHVSSKLKIVDAGSL